ncbi:MAG TPA: TonB-dependent receptor [Gemmatimonadaceae bacterium]|nr:TonB-dependent receptor [Gemmatimonadaceae bacterium]
MTAHLLVLSFLSAALQQPPARISGQIQDSATHAPVANVIVLDVASRRQTVTDHAGRFSLDAELPARLHLARYGYATREVIATSTELNIALASSPRTLEAVTITAIRGGSGEQGAPVSQRTITRDEIEKRSFGQEVPLLLQGTPSITSYAETGNYWGYSYTRLRGIDQSRINLTIDGIPLNDPEDQVLYFADFPDLASSLESVQIQRGVGTSSAGTASFAGSMNFETAPLAAAAGTRVELEGGSFGSKRASAEYRSGLLTGGLAFYGRLSGLQSDGFRYHSGVLGRSALVSAGYFGSRDVFKVMATAGQLHDTLSYLAVPDTELARDRRINPLQPTELDRFGEQLVSAAYTRMIGATSSLSTTLYRISASGNYDVAIDPDLWNYHLDFVWYGLTSAWAWQRDGARVQMGVNMNRYARDHYAFVRPDLVDEIYFNTGHKGDVSGFVKLAYDLGRATLFGDLQARRAEFRYAPDVHADIPGRSIAWTFVNPRAGITYRLTPALAAYASYGVTSREPARSDMFAGFDNLDTSNVAFVGDLSRVRPETVHDVESGVTLTTSRLRLQANVFSMDFRNEIEPIGALSYQGLPLRKNVHASYRRGVEIDAAYGLTSSLRASVNATLMRGRIADYTDDASGESFHGVDPLLTPKVISAQRLEWNATRSLSLWTEGRYTGQSQLDNTGNPRLILPEAYVWDAAATWHFAGRHSIEVRGNNITNSKRYGSGYGGGDTPYYYVLPPRNLFVTLQLGF